MASVEGTLGRSVSSAAERRYDHAGDLLALVPELGRACRSMAERFRDGALLRPMGAGVSAIDAAHVAVEFIHPVIVGKRALPALVLDPAHVGDTVPGSVVLGLRLTEDPHLHDALEAAHGRGCLTVDLGTVDLGTADDGDVTDHVLAVGTDDVLVARELQVTAYHLLWEVVHEHLDATPTHAGDRVQDPAGDLSSLYPFLGDARPDAAGVAELDLSDSTERKIREVAALRSECLDTHAARLADAGAALRSSGTVWTFGNGGSCTDASAVARLLRERGLPGRPHPAHALSDDVATLTALTNDVRFDVVFARMLRTLARPGDVAVGFSTSGNSANVLEGLAAAHELGCRTIGFAGYDGGDMAGVDGLDHLFVVPSSSVHRIQEAQTTLAHVLVEVARGQ